MIMRLIFFSIFIPILELYAKIFVAGEKFYRQYAGPANAKYQSDD